MGKPKKEKKTEGLFKGVFMAYFILIFHVVLLGAVGCLVLFFRGFVQYMLWIFLGGTALILASALYFLRRFRKEKEALGDTLRSPAFRGRSVEISLLGGMASVKLGQSQSPSENPALDGSGVMEPARQLEDPTTARIRELSALARLLEEDLITREEYNKVKQQIFKAYG